MATPIKFPSYAMAMTTCVPDYMRTYCNVCDKWSNTFRSLNWKEADRLLIILIDTSRAAELEVFQNMCRSIASLEVIQLKRGGIHIHPRISWEHSWSELSSYLQLDGIIVACTDGNARLSVCGYRPRTWKKAVREHLNMIVYINDKVQGYKSYHEQVYERIEDAIAEPFSHLTLESNDVE